MPLVLVAFLLLVVLPGATSSIALVTSSDALVTSSVLLLVVLPGATSSFLLLVVMPLLLVAMPLFYQ